MAAKLRSITKQIHWSLAVKSAVVALAWLLLPLWVFFALAAFFYAFPFFRGAKFAPFFLLMLLFAVLGEPGHIEIAILLGVGFYLLLGIKDLLLVHRVPAYEALIFIYFFLGISEFFRIVSSVPLIITLVWSLAMGAFFVFSLLSYEEYREGPHTRRHEILIVGMGGLLVAETSFFLTFLPIDSLPGSALIFLATVSIFEFISQGLFHKMPRANAFIIFSVFIGLSALLLASLDWRF